MECLALARDTKVPHNTTRIATHFSSDDGSDQRMRTPGPKSSRTPSQLTVHTLRANTKSFPAKTKLGISTYRALQK